MEKFSIVKKLGQGGFGKVYLARRIVDKEELVLKIYREKVDWERIEKSLELAMTLQHPNLMKCYSFFHDRIATSRNSLTGKSSVHIIALLESLSGDNLYQAYVNCNETFSHYLSQLIGALKYLHGKKIVHGDIKPDNILVVQGKVKLIDYDFLSREKDVKKGRMGTPLFSAPEIYQKKRVTCKSDLWSLGVTIYYCLTGKYPYVARTHSELIDLINSDYTPNYFKLPERYHQIVSRLLQKSPENRLSLSQIGQILT